MLAGMGTATLREWQAYYAVEPFGEYRSELRHGQIMALTANINRDTKARPQPFSGQDFMNFVDKPAPPEMTAEEAFARIDRDVFGL